MGSPSFEDGGLDGFLPALLFAKLRAIGLLGWLWIIAFV